MNRVKLSALSIKVHKLRIPAGLPVAKLFTTGFSPSRNPNDRAPLNGSPGLYRVTFVLGCPSPLANEQAEMRLTDQGCLLTDQGDSLLSVPQAGAQPTLDLPHVGADVEVDSGLVIHVDGYVNCKGRLATLVAPNVNAENFSSAEFRAQTAVSRVLSQLAVRFNTPIWIARIASVEAATGSHRFSSHAPFPVATFPDSLESGVSGELMLYASLYHEALKSNSEAYQFLCFYKIIEGLRARRGRIAKECRARGEEIPCWAEPVPSNADEAIPWLNDLFEMKSQWGPDNIRYAIPREARGRKFSYVIQAHLAPLRVGIAHAVLDTGEPTLVADEPAHVGRIYYWLGVTMCIARQMMKHDFPWGFAGIQVPTAFKDLKA